MTEYDERRADYMQARCYWHLMSKKDSAEDRTDAYNRLTKLWYALSRDEQRIVGAECVIRFH